MTDPSFDGALTVRMLMTPDPIMVSPATCVRAAVTLMNSQRIGSLLIGSVDRLEGIFSERDLVRLAAVDAPGWEDWPIERVMTREPITIPPEAGWEQAVALMERRHIRHLPVMESDKVIGIISARQLMARRTDHLDQLVQRRTRELSERDALLQQQLKLAGGLLERALLPQQPPAAADLAWAVRYAPLDSLGGDYYDFVTDRRDALGVLIADAAGHSVAAAMVAVMARIAFAEAVREATRPAEVLSRMNDRLAGFTDERFVTAFYARLDRPARRLICANAGHPRPLHYSSRTGTCASIGPAGLPLGITDSVDYAESLIDLDPGDRIVFYTDGVTDAMNTEGDAFGTARLTQSVEDHADEPALAMLHAIETEWREFRGGAASNDDITLLVAEVR